MSSASGDESSFQQDNSSEASASSSFESSGSDYGAAPKRKRKPATSSAARQKAPVHGALVKKSRAIGSDEDSDGSSESSDFTPGASKSRSKKAKGKRKRRRKKAAILSLTSNPLLQADHDVDSDADMDDIDPEDILEYTWVTPADERKKRLNTIDAVLDSRQREKVVKDEESTDTADKEEEYLIKWMDRAHIHASWLTRAEARGKHGIRKLDNFIAKQADVQNYYLQTTNEEREIVDIERETHREQLEEYRKVERVIGEFTFHSLFINSSLA